MSKLFRDPAGVKDQTRNVEDAAAIIRERGDPYDNADARMDAIARNGNTGEHYDLARSPTPANYISLQAVLDRAFDQAAHGKGATRRRNRLRSNRCRS